MEKIIKKIILAGLVVSIIILSLDKLAFFDPSTIKIDNFTLERPSFYKYLGDSLEIKLNNKNYYSTVVSFLGILDNNIASYMISKRSSKDHFLELSNRVPNKTNSDISECNILVNITPITIDNNNSIQLRTVLLFMFPYIVSFSEISNIRESSSIKQFCGDNKINWIFRSSSSLMEL